MNADATGTVVGTAIPPEPALSARLVADVVRDIDIAQVVIASGLAQSLKVDRIEFGQATVEQLIVAGASAHISSGHALLERVRATVQVTVTVSLHVGLPWPFDDINASVDIGLPVVTPPISDIEVPMLGGIDLAIPAATISDAAAQIAAVSNLDLGSGAFKDVNVTDTKLPTAGFNLLGLQLGAVALSRLGVPAAAARSLGVGEFRPGAPIVLPAVELGALQLPSVEVPEAFSTGDVFLPGVTVSPDPASAGLGPASVTVSAVATVALTIGKITVRDLELRLSVEKIRLEGTQVPVTVRGITMGNVGLNSLTVNQISV